MTADTVHTVLTAGALLATGLQAGLYYGFAVAVSPGLRRSADRVHVEAFQEINVAIVGPAFLVTFLGAPLASVAAAVVDLAAGRPAAYTLAAAVLALAAFAVTATRNVPLNNRLAAAGPAAALRDPAATVAAFAPAWHRWNVVRTVLHMAAGVCLAVGLVG